MIYICIYEVITTNKIFYLDFCPNKMRRNVLFSHVMLQISLSRSISEVSDYIILCYTLFRQKPNKKHGISGQIVLRQVFSFFFPPISYNNTYTSLLYGSLIICVVVEYKYACNLYNNIAVYRFLTFSQRVLFLIVHVFCECSSTCKIAIKIIRIFILYSIIFKYTSKYNDIN